MKINEIFTIKEYDEAYQYVSTHEGTTIKDLGNGQYQLIDITPTPEEITKDKEELFNKEFFNTSLGYVKRKVTMQDGSTKDFLSDVLPMLIAGVPIITYNKPDFSKEELPTQNRNVIVTEGFIEECKKQFMLDFYGVQKGE